MSAALLLVGAPTVAQSTAGFNIDFTLGVNGDPLSGYTGWFGTTGISLDDGVGTLTRGMRSTNVGFNESYRDSGLFNGTFSARIRLEPSGNDYTNLVARLRGDGLGGVFISANSSDSHWHIVIYDPSGVLQLDYDTGVAFTPGGTYDRQLVLSGTSVIAKVAGSQVGATQTDSWSVGGSQSYVGFGINGNGATLAIVQSISAVI